MLPQDNQDENILTVSELTGLIKNLLEGSFRTICLKGEISNFKLNSTGHLYFQLKDNFSQISAVMFRGRAGTLSFKPKDGDLVTVWGSVTVYEPQGKYQIVVTKMIPSGNGGIMEMIEERKKRLNAEGLFDQTGKKPVPYFPKTVGIVTSPTGAALRDIMQIAKRRNSKVSITILPSLVQGTEAGQSIAKNIKTANDKKLCDVLIVGRGGGSLEDLLPFSEECVVRAVAESEIPVISAVGHEIDWSLCDFAADVRAPTPSAAAELAIPLEQEISDRILQAKDILYRTALEKTNAIRIMLKQFTPEGMELSLRSIEQPLLNRYDRALENLKSAITEKISEKKQKIRDCTAILENCNPQTVFDRGYSMVTDKNGNIIKKASQVKPGDKILIKPSSGTINAIVGEINE